MRRFPLLCSLLFLFTIATAQPGNKLYPTTTKSLVVFQLKDFEKVPISKAPLRVAAANGSVAYEGKTDKNGVWECLLPINQAYWISVGDSENVGQVTIPNKPSTITRHTTYFHGWINGKLYGVERPLFNMMPPADGQAVIDMEFVGLQGQPLVGETVTLTADGSQKVYVDSTDANGKVQMRVPIGENYSLAVPYNDKFYHFEFPAHGGSYNAKVSYVYAGKQALAEMRAQREASQREYDAYEGLSAAEQRAKRDKNGFKTVFNTIPIRPSQAPFEVKTTEYGYALSLDHNTPVSSPCYTNGLIVAGAGWDSDQLAAVKAETGEPFWTIELEEAGISNINGGDNVIVCATESCTIYVIAAPTGKLLWSKWLATYVLSAPCIADGKVYIGYEDVEGSAAKATTGGIEKPYVMACFDLKTGAIDWQQWISGEVMSSPVADGANLYFNTFSGYSYVLNRENGAVVAEQQLFATSAPTIVGGQVCMSQRDAHNAVARERIALFNPATLALVRASPFQDAPYIDPKSVRKTQFASTANNISLNTGSSSTEIAKAEDIGPEELVGTESIFAVQTFEGSRPLALNGKVYVAQGHVLRCLDAKTLLQVWEWQYPTSLSDDGGACMAPPIAVDGKVVVACMDGALRAFDPASGRIVTSYATGEKHRQQPIAAQGNFYAPCVDGKLAVIQTGNPAIDKWFCWGGNPSRTNTAK
jgi:outer membrane protein assembly factor BamB